MEDRDPYLAAIVVGDPDAFASWLGGAEAPLRSSLTSFVRWLDVESVLQESLLRVWQVAPRFQPDGWPYGLLRLALRIARNRAIDELRRLHTRAESVKGFESGSGGSGPRAAPIEPDPGLRRIIEGRREALPNRPGKVLSARLSSAGGESDAKLAESLGMRLNTFLQNFTRARRLLEKCLEQHGIVVAETLG